MKADIHPEYVEATVALLVRQHLHHPLDQARPARRAVQRVPPVLHGQAEARRHRWPRRALPAPLRPAARPAPRSAERGAAPRVSRRGRDAWRGLEKEFDADRCRSCPTPTSPSDHARLRDLSRRHSELGELVATWRELEAGPERPGDRPRDARGRRRARTASSSKPRSARPRTASSALAARARAAAAAHGPQRRAQRHRRDPRRRGRRGGQPVRPRPLRDVPALRRRRAAGRSRSSRQTPRERDGLERGDLHGQGRRRLARASSTRAARTASSGCR